MSDALVSIMTVSAVSPRATRACGWAPMLAAVRLLRPRGSDAHHDRRCRWPATSGSRFRAGFEHGPAARPGSVGPGSRRALCQPARRFPFTWVQVLLPAGRLYPLDERHRAHSDTSPDHSSAGIVLLDVRTFYVRPLTDGEALAAQLLAEQPPNLQHDHRAPPAVPAGRRRYRLWTLVEAKLIAERRPIRQARSTSCRGKPAPGWRRALGVPESGTSVMSHVRRLVRLRGESPMPWRLRCSTPC